MSELFSTNPPVRIFVFSAVSSVAILLAVVFGIGWAALGTTLILTIIEITFSFDNAIINAKVLAKVGKFWQTIFLSVGIIVAVVGMRIIFPIVIVALTADLSWSQVVNLALHNPVAYAAHLELAHPTISAFGGAFLLMLAQQYFFRDEHKELWFKKFERQLKRLKHWSAPTLVSVAVVALLALLPANEHARTTLTAGLLGIATYVVIDALVHWLEKLNPGKGAAVGKQVGMAAVTTLIYLEILDASFSFDGVIGAFAITSDVVLIAAGLGIGALWVRSLTVYMVRRGTLNEYVFLEHGAHYTVLALAIILLASIVFSISDFIPGLMGVAIIGSSIAASVRTRKQRDK